MQRYPVVVIAGLRVCVQVKCVATRRRCGDGDEAMCGSGAPVIVVGLYALRPGSRMGMSSLRAGPERKARKAREKILGPSGGSGPTMSWQCVSSLGSGLVGMGLVWLFGGGSTEVGDGGHECCGEGNSSGEIIFHRVGTWRRREKKFVPLGLDVGSMFTLPVLSGLGRGCGAV